MERKRETKSRELLRRLSYNKAAVFGLAIIFVVILCAVLANFIAPNNPFPSPPQLSLSLKPGFWSPDGVGGMALGTDALGRCVLSRIIYGARVSLSAAIVAVGIAMVLGIALGVLAGYYGGWVDAALMRIVDIMFAFPALLLAIAIVAVIGRGLDKAMIAIGIVYTPQMARIIRSSVLYIREMEYIEAEKAVGCSNWRIIIHHVIPNSMAPVIVYGTLMMASAILDDGISYSRLRCSWFSGTGCPTPHSRMGRYACQKLSVHCSPGVVGSNLPWPGYIVYGTRFQPGRRWTKRCPGSKIKDIE